MAAGCNGEPTNAASPLLGTRKGTRSFAPIAARRASGCARLSALQLHEHRPMQRRTFFALLSGAAVWPVNVRSQQKPMPTIGFLSSRSAGESEPFVAAFSAGLLDAGFAEGRDANIEYRWADNQYERLPEVRMHPAVIV